MALVPLAEPPDPPRRRGARSLPAYRHVPGLTPHPVTHPDGHSFGASEPEVSVEGLSLPGDWRQCDEYLEGVDLFNRAYLWEAHEAWEAVWHAVGHGTTTGRYLQGLIQAAAALLKRHVDMPRGAASLHAKALGNLAPAQDWRGGGTSGRFMGVALTAWQGELEFFLAGRSDRYPYLVLPD